MKRKQNRGKIKTYSFISVKRESNNVKIVKITELVCEYLEFPYFGYNRRIRTTSEKRSWFNYMDELKDNGLVLHKNRRTFNNIPNAWDDFKNATNSHNVRDWKKHYKCKKQWMKNL